MCGSGKSIACDVLREQGWDYLRFGQITIDRLKAEGREITEANEREMRESLRKEHGMGAYALLSLPRIEELLEKNDVVIDGLYSWSEYKALRERFEERFTVVCIYASPETRYSRLEERVHDEQDLEHRMRTLTQEQAKERDYAEIENLEKGGPIAMADHTIVNEASLEDLLQAIRSLAS
jgi:dephospho-CoA kinase